MECRLSLITSRTSPIASDAVGAIPDGTMIANNGTNRACDQSFASHRGELGPISTWTACTASAVEVEIALCPDWTVTTADELDDCIFEANANGVFSSNFTVTNGGGTWNDNGYNLSDDNTGIADGPCSFDNAEPNLGDLVGGVHPPLKHSDAIGSIPNVTTIVDHTTSFTTQTNLKSLMTGH